MQAETCMALTNSFSNSKTLSPGCAGRMIEQQSKAICGPLAKRQGGKDVIDLLDVFVELAAYLPGYVAIMSPIVTLKELCLYAIHIVELVMLLAFRLYSSINTVVKGFLIIIPERKICLRRIAQPIELVLPKFTALIELPTKLSHR